MPFNRQEFLDVFAAYNAAIWPAHLVAYAVGALALVGLWMPRAFRRRIVLTALAVLWAWTGIGYHILFFASINPVAILFGVIFLAQALLLVAFAVRNHRPELSLRSRTRWIGWGLVMTAIVAYPLAAMLAGDVYPRIPMFGVTPCPLDIFTFGILLFSRTRIPWVLLLIPLLWSVVGGSAALLLGLYQDIALPVAAACAVLAQGILRPGTSAPAVSPQG